MIIDTHTHVVSTDKVKHPLHPEARGWSTEVSNNVEDLIAEMDRAGVDAATLVQPNGTYGLDNTYQCDSANQYAPRTVSVGILDPAAPDAADKLSYWVNEHGMKGVRLQSQAEPDDPQCDALWQRAESLGVPISIGGGGQPEKVDRMRNVGARHPNVLFAPDHFAGWSGADDKAAMTAALENLARLPNAYLRISSTSLGPYAGLTQPEKDLFRRVIEAFTPQRVMWGSNFPSSREGGYAGQAQLGQTALPWLSQEDIGWIMGGTAHKLWPMLQAPGRRVGQGISIIVYGRHTRFLAYLSVHRPGSFPPAWDAFHRHFCGRDRKQLPFASSLLWLLVYTMIVGESRRQFLGVGAPGLLPGLNGAKRVNERETKIARPSA